jgi:hypothetical protein
MILELKSGAILAESLRQVEEYALLLHYFHKPSFQRKLFPVVISPSAVPTGLADVQQREFGFEELPSTWITSTSRCNWHSFPELLCAISAVSDPGAPIDPNEWASGAYFPVPTIIDAALALRTGLKIREIAHSEASEHEVEEVTRAIQSVIQSAIENKEFVVCFLTGVPGSGKTLVGLGLAHSRENQGPAIHFMSGNGPLVKVLQHLFSQQAMQDGVPAPHARIHARTLIENVHIFARHYADDAPNEIPSNNVVIFDEAQRAWNRQQNFRKFRRNYSEPQMLISIMERHPEWAAIIALVGGGQEINDGEAGLEEWGLALQQSKKQWKIFASPEVLDGGESTAGHKLFDDPTQAREISALRQLHLRTSNRSLRAENMARWVNAVIAGDAVKARDLHIAKKFPLFLTRSLSVMRSTLRRESLANSRYGLAGSSGATRLRAEGLEPDSTFHGDYPWEHWYLGDKGDVRSSYQCEVFATEFEIQGLELDWVGLCWGGDFIWNLVGWSKRKYRPGPIGKWMPIKHPEKQKFRENAYRVLLTRARQGVVIFVPRGDSGDASRDPHEFDSTARFLIECGVKSID